MQTKSFSVLYHIGTLVLEHKARHYSHSWEGHGLSVSECPWAWQKIARLGGMPLWRLTRPGNQFLDYYALSQLDQQTILEWGMTHDWVTLKSVWVASYFDDEAEQTMSFYVNTQEAALAELNCDSESDLSEDQSIEQKTVPTPTSRMTAYIGFKVEDVCMPDMLALAYADHVLNLDGVFWDDTLAPQSLSAPCAVIFPQRVSSWTIKQVAEHDNVQPLS